MATKLTFQVSPCGASLDLEQVSGSAFDQDYNSWRAFSPGQATRSNLVWVSQLSTNVIDPLPAIPHLTHAIS
jgi:hypothetical protein